jgi:hypothetical protein
MSERQLKKYEFEDLAWEARIDPVEKLIAFAISNHMGANNPKADPSVERIAYMCNVSVRTVQRYLPKIEKALGLKIIRQPGKRYSFELQVFRTASELQDMLSSEPWQDANWYVFSVERNPRKPDAPCDLERILADIEAVTQEAAGELPLNGHAPLNGAEPPTHLSPPTRVSPPTITTSTPDTGVTPPPTRVSPKPPNNLHKNPSECARPNGMNGSHLPLAKKKGRKSKVAAVKYTADFDRWWQDYRKAMQRAGGKAAKNARGMSKPKAFEAWVELNLFECENAQRFITPYARDAGEYMVAAGRYLCERIFEGYAEDAAEQAERLDPETRALAEYLAGQRRWSDNMQATFRAPPGEQGCCIPAEQYRKAEAEAERLREAQNA